MFIYLFLFGLILGQEFNGAAGELANEGGDNSEVQEEVSVGADACSAGTCPHGFPKEEKNGYFVCRTDPVTSHYACPSGCKEQGSWPWCVIGSPYKVCQKRNCGTPSRDSSNGLLSWSNGCHDHSLYNDYSINYGKWCIGSTRDCDACGGTLYKGGNPKTVPSPLKARYWQLSKAYPCLGTDVLGACAGEDVKLHKGCTRCSGTQLSWCSPCPPTLPNGDNNPNCDFDKYTHSPHKHIGVCYKGGCQAYYDRFNSMCELVTVKTSGSNVYKKYELKTIHKRSKASNGFRNNYCYAGESFIRNKWASTTYMDNDRFPSICDLYIQKHWSNDYLIASEYPVKTQPFGWDKKYDCKCAGGQQHGNGCDQCHLKDEEEGTTAEPPSTTTKRTSSTSTTPEVQAAPDTCVKVCHYGETEACKHTGPDCSKVNPGSAIWDLKVANPKNYCEAKSSTNPQQQWCPTSCDQKTDLIDKTANQIPNGAGSNVYPRHNVQVETDKTELCVFQKSNPGPNAMEVAFAADDGGYRWNHLLIFLAWVNSLMFIYAIPIYQNKNDNVHDYTNLTSSLE